LESFLNWTSDFIENILNWDFDKAFKKWDNVWKFQTIIQDNLNPVLTLLEGNKQELSKLDSLLKNPKAIWEYKPWDKINTSELSNKELSKYLLWLNEKVLGYDDQINSIVWMKEWLITGVSKAPWIVQIWFKKILNFLLGLPFIWDLLAGLLWYDSPKKAIEWFWEEMKMAQATNVLGSFWWDFDKLWVKKSDSTNDNEIWILKDKNLEELSYKKLTPFYAMCKKEWIDYSATLFWEWLFNWVKDKPKDKEKTWKDKNNKITWKVKKRGNSFRRFWFK